MKRLLQFGAGCSLWLLCCGSGANARTPVPAPRFEAPEGAYSVTIADDVKVHDRKRNRDLLVKVYAPDGPGHFPVLLFSHGLGGSKESFGPLARYWASHGFVVVHPSHPDALAGSASPSGRPAQNSALGNLLARTAASPSAGASRARDLSAVIDGLPQVEAAVPTLKGKLDRKRIGIGGHGLGALAAMLMGGTTVDLSESEKDRAFLDPRVRAVLAVSGPGAGRLGLTERSWRKVFLPLLAVTGSQDRDDSGQGLAAKRQPFELSRPGDKYLLFVQGASHYSFGGELAGGGLAASGLGPGVRARLSGGRRVGFGGRQVGDQSGIFEPVKAATLAFWNACLKEDGKAKAYLLSNRLSSDTQGMAALSHR